MILWQDVQVYFWVGFVISALVCSALSAHVASVKGHGFGSWVIIGFLFGVLGLIAAAGLPKRQDPEVDVSARDLILTKKCPVCAELVKIEARVCKYCGYGFDDDEAVTAKLESIAKQHEGLESETQAQQLLGELKNRPRD